MKKYGWSSEIKCKIIEFFSPPKTVSKVNFLSSSDLEKADRGACDACRHSIGELLRMENYGLRMDDGALRIWNQWLMIEDKKERTDNGGLKMNYGEFRIKGEYLRIMHEGLRMQDWGFRMKDWGLRIWE